MNQAEGVRQIVERARAGDQVAMALIDQTRQQADRGNKKAQHSRKLIKQYLKKHRPSTIAGDLLPSVNTNPAAQTALWKAQKASPDVFAGVVAKVAPYVGPWALISAIFHGPKLAKGTPLMVAAATPKSKIAACVRRAFRLQRIAHDHRVPISSYCVHTAAELGE
jgi:hypothetical protein